MMDEEIRLLKELSEEVKTWDKEQSESFLKRVGILDKDGEISENYPELKKFNKSSEKTL